MQDRDFSVGSDNESCNKEGFWCCSRCEPWWLLHLWIGPFLYATSWATLKLERAWGTFDACKFCIHIIFCSFDEHKNVHWPPIFTQSNKKCIFHVHNMESILKRTLSIHYWFYSIQWKLLNRSLVSFEWSQRHIVWSLWWYDLSKSIFFIAHTKRSKVLALC
jgi:hypothetical protein